MRIYFFTTLFLISGILASAQETTRTFKPFRLDLGLGLGIPFHSNLHRSAVFSLEPRYAFSDRFSGGLRLEYVNLGPMSVIGFIGDFNPTTSMILTGDYYFGTGRSRGFLGTGLGVFDVPVENEYFSDVHESETKFGIMTRGGIEISRFRGSAEWNITGKNEIANFSYLTLKIGYYFWGSRVK